MSLYLRGANENVSLGNLDFPAPTSQFTMCIWFNRESTNNMFMFSKSNGTRTGDSHWTLAVDTAGRVYGRLLTGSSTTQVKAAERVGLGKWYHAAMTYDGINISLFVDGLLQLQTSTSGDIPIGTGMPVAIGGTAADPTSRAFIGQVADARLYTRALTERDVLNIYNSDSKDNNVDGLIHWWPLREGPAGQVASSTIHDIVGNINGTSVGNPYYLDDFVRYAR